MELVFDRFKSKKGKWNKLNFVLPNFVSSWLEINYSGNEDSEDHAGLQLRFFSPKNNQHVGELMPITGICISSEKVSGNSGWYRVHLDQPLSISLYHQHTVLVKPKIQGMSLSDDKIEIYFMIIPRLKSDLPEEFDMDKLRYTGRVYSRPVQK